MGTERNCFGAYENGEECTTCLLAIACIEATITEDGWFDLLAEKEAELKRYEQEGGHECW